MTVLLILFTLIIFLIADFFIQRARASRAQAAEMPERDLHALPADVELMLNHTWVRREHDGSYTIGLDDLLNRIAGEVERVVLPAPGCALAEGDGGVALGAGDRSLAVGSPVAGRVVEVNRAVLAEPALAHRDPYGTGWLMKVQPFGGRPTLSHRLAVSTPIEWLNEQADLVREFFLAQMRTAQGVSLADGGVPVDGVLQRCDAPVWGSFQRSFVALPEPVTADAGKGRRP